MLSRTLLRTVARSSSPRTFSSLSSALPRSSSSRVAAAFPSSSSIASRSFFSGSGSSAAEKPAAASEAQAEAATPDVQAEQAKAEASDVQVEDPKVAELEAKVKAQSEQITELTNAIKYSAADYENLKRRSAEEFAQASEKGIKRFASDLLSTIDILSLALKHVPQPIPADNAALQGLYSGVEMTQVELLKTLKKHGVEPIEALGEKFDPHFHEALFQVQMPDKEPGSVMDVSQVGYTLKGKSLRAAQVGVVRE